MKTHLIIILVFFGQVVFAQFSTENVISTCEICTPEDLHSADIDGDGDNDILVVSSVDDKISWFENIGGGSFNGPLVISRNIPKASAVLADDFNGDGHLDIAVSAISDRRIGILYNDGLGRFSEPDFMPYLSLLVESFVSGDIDNDGDIDIVCAEQSAASWYENLGNGEFIKHWIDQVSTIRVVQIADIDGDNDLDVIVGSNQVAKISWYENVGAGDFAEATVVTEIGANVFSISTGDIDSDGDVDILGKGFFADRLAWYPNDGTGNFGEGVDISSDQDRGLSTSIVDIDDDGDLDIVSASSYNMGQVFCYPNDGNGDFLDQISIEYDIPSVKSIFIIDIDNDGLLDIVGSAQKYNQISWYRNESNLNFSEEILSYNPNHSPSRIVASDIDQNGFQDLAILSSEDNNIYWYLNNGNEQIIRKNNINTDLVNLSLDVGLLNDDAYPDILISNNSGVSWMENNGVGDFLSESIVFNGNNTIRRNAIIADLNGDGKNDILTCARYLDNIEWMQNTGSGDFTSPTIISSEIEEPEYLLAVDINDDGYEDVISSTSKGNIVYFENMGDDTFSDYEQIDSLGISGTPINSCDLDGDGDQDIMTVYGEYVIWYRNDGSGVFSEKQIIYEHISRLYSQSIFCADLDGDGDKEVIVGAYSSILTSEADNTTGIIYLENLGDGNFSGKKNIGIANHFNYIYPSDINSDGDYDVFVSSRDNAQISWYENLFDYPTISGRVFYDENENGNSDILEQSLQNVPVTITPDALSSYTDSTGSYRFYVDDGNYSITTNPDSCWVLTTDSLSYSVSIDNSSFSDLNFGYSLSSENPHVQPRLYSHFTRCGFEIGFDLKLENDGCTVASGLFGLVLNDLITYVDASIDPEIINGDTLWWSYSDILPTELTSVNIIFEIAGVDFIGEVIIIDVLSLIENEDTDLVPGGTYLYQSEIQCAYDPNDKIVYPNRRDRYEENYTLLEEPIEYTIRFQNTGTDTAFTVILRDTLDESFDLGTFRPITGSHSFETFLSEDGLIEFHFNDILLPDSTTNEIESHGYVSFKINPKNNLGEFTEIFNSAGIYFDFNLPVITNTVKNVLVSELPIINSIISERGASVFSIYPNPSMGFVKLFSDLTEDFRVDFHTLSGGIIRSFDVFGKGEFSFDISDVPSGVYLVSVQYGSMVECQRIVVMR